MLMRKSWEHPRARDRFEILSRVPLFSRVGKRQLRRIAALAKLSEFAPGDMIIQAGERGDGLYLIVGGRAKVIGKSRRTYGPGDFFGELALIDGGPRSATITATTEVQAMIVPHRQFMKIVEQEPRVALGIMAELAARIRRLERAPD